MREIVFRGKSIKENKWVYGYYWVNKENHFIKEVIYESAYFKDNLYGKEEILNDIEIKTDTVGQYVGLKDKHGIEIYEGDLVKVKNIDYLIGKVVYDKEYLCYQIEVDEQVIFPVSVCYGDYNELDIEAIGNIWDNPELLKESD